MSRDCICGFMLLGNWVLLIDLYITAIALVWAQVWVSQSHVVTNCWITLSQSLIKFVQLFSSSNDLLLTIHIAHLFLITMKSYTVFWIGLVKLCPHKMKVLHDPVNWVAETIGRGWFHCTRDHIQQWCQSNATASFFGAKKQFKPLHGCCCWNKTS